MNVSIIICTYNRCESLRRVLQTACGLKIPAGLRWELVVVDNNSTDATQTVCRDFESQLLLRMIVETRQGKSYALNTGVQVSRGELLLFTDDDVEIDANWLAAFWDAFTRHPDRCFFGGRVLPRWERSPPEWVVRHYARLPVFPHLDWGELEKPARVLEGELFIGCNYAFPRQVFRENHSFIETVGFLESDTRRGYRVSGEDTEFVRDIAKAGWTGVYVPGAVIVHLHQAVRCTEKYLRSYYIGSGMMLVRLDDAPPTSRLILGVPRFLWRILLRSVCAFLCARWFRSSGHWVPAECKMAFTWGQIIEYRQQWCAGRDARQAQGRRI